MLITPLVQPALVGSTYQTWQKAPVAGVYAFVKHLDGTPCLAVLEEEARIKCSRGEPLPQRCGKDSVWKLVLVD